MTLRRSPLGRGKPLRSSGGLARNNERTTGLKPSGWSAAGTGRRDRAPRRKPMPRPRVWEPSEDETNCRAIVAQRSAGLCEQCGKARPLEKAHRVAAGQGGAWQASNILDLCRDCHQGRNHAHPEAAYRHGWHLRRNSDPTTTPTLLIKQGRQGWVLLDDDGGWRWDTDADRTAA